MIVMIADEQILSAKQVCRNCLMADQSGLPRWHGEELHCGEQYPAREEPGLRSLRKALQKTSNQATIYRCQMGFDVTQVE